MASSLEMLLLAQANFLLNPPIARIRQGVAQSIPNAANTAITFDASDFDTYSGHSNVTNNTRYTTVVPGYYQIAAIVNILTTTSNGAWAFLRLNGTTAISPLTAGPVPSASTSRSWFVDSLLWFLNVGDYVELIVNQNDGSAKNTNIGSNQYCVMTIKWEHQ